MTSTQIQRASSTGEQDELQQKFLTFKLKGEHYGIDIRDVIEIIGIQRITPVPGVPPAVQGVINLRGKVVPVIDVRMRFGLEQQQYHERTCIIVVDVRDNPVGLVVDTVAEVVDIHKDQIEQPPDLTPGAHNEVMAGLGKVGDEVKILINVEPLVITGGFQPSRLNNAAPAEVAAIQS